MAFALDGSAYLALRQQAAQLPIGSAITRIDDHIRRTVGEGQAAADEKPEIALVAKILPCRMCPHHAGQRVAVGNADTGQAKLMCTRYQFLRMRRTAQEGEIAGSSHFKIMSHHANSPCKTSADDWRRHKGLRGKSRNAGRSRLPPGNNRAVPEPCDRLRATIPVRSFPVLRQGAHDGAPVATGRTKADCRALPPRFRSTVAGETVLWGALAGRREAMGKCCRAFVIGFALPVRVQGRAQAEGPFGNMRVARKETRTRFCPSRAESRSTSWPNPASSSSCWSSPVWRWAIGALRSAASRIMSKPKPASSGSVKALSLSRARRRKTSSLRKGWPVSMWI